MTTSNSTAPTLPAEWEPQDAIILAWPHEHTDWQPVLNNIRKTCLELIKQITRFESVVLFIPNQNEFDSIRPLLLQNKINPEKIIPVFADYNDTWLRDTGPLTVRTNGGIKHLDYRFNGWGNKFEHGLDDKLCEQLFKHPKFEKNHSEKFDINLEGGGIDSDGQGTLLTTRQCLLNPNRNPGLSMQDYESQFRSQLGIKKVHWLQHGEIIGDDTDGHIDMLARFCSATTIVYSACLDPNDPHFEPLRRMKIELEKLADQNGNSYQLTTLPVPAAIFDQNNARLPASYCNFLIINKAVLVPVYDDPNDELACKELATCFPEREIIPVDALTMIQQGGSLHCLTMQLPEGSYQ